MNASDAYAQRQDRVRSLFDLIVGLPQEEQATWLADSATTVDPVVAEVRSLIKYCQRTSDPLEAGVQLSQSVGGLIEKARLRESGQRIGKFEVRRVLGVGGFGAVYLCWDPLLHRDVAVKLPHVSPGGAPVDFERQLQEAQRVAALDCAGIVPVYEGGLTDEGTPYFAMKYIAGETLEDKLHGQPPTAAEAAELLAGVVDVLAVVHEKGVVHRDLKPTNIIFDEAAVPYIADFGLAVSPQQLDQAASLAGTPAYMAPEQFQGQAAPLDARCDIWALGVILHELLTGRRPFSGSCFSELKAEILEKPATFAEMNSPPEGAVLESSSFPTDLQAVCMKCLQKSPDDRFQSARELAEALRKSCPQAERSGTLRRKWAGAGVSLTAALLAVVFVVAAAVYVGRTEARREVAETQAAANALRLAKLHYRNDMVSAFDAYNQNWPDQVRQILDRYLPGAGEPDLRDFAWGLLAALTEEPEPVELLGHEGAVNELAVFPDRKRVASVGEDGRLRFWSIEDRKCVANIDMAAALPGIDLSVGGLHAVAVSPNGRYVAAGADVVGICDLQQGNEVRELYRTDWNVESLRFTPDGERIAAGVRYDHVALLALNGDILAHAQADGRHRSLEYLPGRRQWLVGTRSHTLQLWDENLSPVDRDLQFELPHVFRVLPGEKRATIGGTVDQNVHVVDLGTGEQLHRGELHRGSLLDMDVSTDGSTVALARSNGLAEYVRWSGFVDGEAVGGSSYCWQAHEGGTSAIRFLDDESLISSGADGRLCIWRTPWNSSQREVHIPGDHKTWRSLSFSPEGLLYVGLDSAIHVVDPHAGRIVESFTDPPRGQQLWNAVHNRMLSYADALPPNLDPPSPLVTMYDAQGAPLWTRDQGVRIPHAAFSPDGRLVALPSRREEISRVEIVRAEDGHLLQTLTPPQGVNLLAFAPTGQWLAATLATSKLIVWDTANDFGRVLCTKSMPDLAGRFVAHPDGRRIATRHVDGYIRIWDAVDGRLVSEMASGDHLLGPMYFSPDGEYLICTSTDAATIWSLEANRKIGVMKGALRFAFSTDARQMAIYHFYSDGSSRPVVICDMPVK